MVACLANGSGGLGRWWAPRPAPLLAAAVEELDLLLGRLAEVVRTADTTGTGAAAALSGRPGSASRALLRRLLHGHLAARPERDLAFTLGLAWAVPALDGLRYEVGELIAEGPIAAGAAGARPWPRVQELAGEIPPLLDLLRTVFCEDDAPLARRVEERARMFRDEAAALPAALAESDGDPDSVVRAVSQASCLREIFTAIASLSTVQGRPYGAVVRRRNREEPTAPLKQGAGGSGIVARR